MAYSDFTLRKLANKFDLKQVKANLFPEPLRRIEPSIILKTEMEEAKKFPLYSEKAKSEAIIFPVLKEVSRINYHLLTVFSGFSFDVDTQKELNGICDYILSTTPDSVEVNAPVFCLVEAKNRTIEEGFGQCAAEMYAARIFNEEAGKPTNIMYGCVTNSTDWIFIKLENNVITIDYQLYGILDLPELLGAFQQIIDFYLNP